MEKTTFIILKHDKMAGEAISHFLVTKGLSCTGCYTENETAYQAALKFNPAFFITEADLPGQNGYDLVRKVKTLARIECIVFSSSSGAFKYEATTVNVSGYVSHNANLEEVFECIQTIQQGRRYISPDIQNLQIYSVPEPNLRRLGEQERNALRLLAQGLENEEIATTLNIMHTTLSSHYRNIKEKLGLHSTRQLTIFAAQNFLKKPINTANK